MSEENKILDGLDTAEPEKPPKKRGRKKKTDTLPKDAVNSEDAVDVKEDANVAAKADNAKDTDTLKNEDSANTAEVENASGDFKDADTANVTDAVNDTCDGENESGKAEEVIDTEENNTSSDEASGTDKLDEGRTDTTDEVCGMDKQDGDRTDMPDEATDETLDGTTVNSGAEESEKKDAYTGIEHFSDTLEIRYLSDEVESAYVAKKEEVEENPLADEEYENLTIFEDSEPSVKREPKQKRVREVSPDYKEYNAEKPRRVDARFDFIELFVYTLVVIMLITTFFFKHSEVSGWSMKGTLADHDHVIISDFLYKPEQNDIVVVHDPEKNEDAVVKRIIALGGQTVRLEYKLNKEKSEFEPCYTLEVFVDGVKLPEKQCDCHDRDRSLRVLNSGHKVTDVKIDAENPERYEYVTFEYVVPNGEVYVMGDHRKDSKDSRTFGSVNENKILGKLIIRFFPFDSFGTVE